MKFFIIIFIITFIILIFMLDAEKCRDVVYKHTPNLAKRIYDVDGMFGLLLIGLVSVIFATTSLFIPIPIQYSDGIKAGTLTRITEKGYIFKTYEGTLNLGGLTSNGNGVISNNVWNFSVDNKEMFEKLQRLQNGVVKLDYVEYLRLPIHVGSTNYLIKDIVK